MMRPGFGPLTPRALCRFGLSINDSGLFSNSNYFERSLSLNLITGTMDQFYYVGTLCLYLIILENIFLTTWRRLVAHIFWHGGAQINFA